MLQRTVSRPDDGITHVEMVIATGILGLRLAREWWPLTAVARSESPGRQPGIQSTNFQLLPTHSVIT